MLGQLLSIQGEAIQVSFTYNALGDRVRIVDQAGGVTTRDDRLVWGGGNTVLAVVDGRSAGANLPRRYFRNGMLAGTTHQYLFTHDHLGSLREVLNASTRNVEVRYDYDPYGQITSTVGNNPTGYKLLIGYAGYVYHEGTGLCLTKYRAYNPTVGKWLSRDPIGEKGGINLYAYVINAPLGLVDPMGLCLPRRFKFDDDDVILTITAYSGYVVDGRIDLVLHYDVIDPGEPPSSYLPNVKFEVDLERVDSGYTNYHDWQDHDGWKLEGKKASSFDIPITYYLPTDSDSGQFNITVSFNGGGHYGDQQTITITYQYDGNHLEILPYVNTHEQQ